MRTKKLICGVGNNNADYVVKKYETNVVDGKKKRKQVWICPYFQTWKNMLARCYSTKYQEKQPTYVGCTVATEWLTFSNFKNWMETQEWQDKQLDKDLLIEGNKVYSPNTCVFVSRRVNMFTTDRGAARGEWMIGVYWNKTAGKFMSQCCNPLTNKREHLGRFDSEQEAHEVWLKRKRELAHLLAAEQTDSRVSKALIDRYMNYSN